MAGLSTSRQPIDTPLSNVALPLATNQTVYSGAALYLDIVAGFVKIGAAGNPNLIPIGTAQQTVSTTSSTGFVLVRLYVELNCQWFDNVTGAGAITALFGLAYVNDDHSVTGVPGGNSVLGRVMQLDAIKGVLVAPQVVPALDTFPGDDAGSASPLFTALGVATVMHAYTGSGTGTLTSTANGTLASQITTAGVTLAVGGVLFAPPGLTGLTGALDSGPWQVVSLGAAGARWVVTRPTWWSTGETWVTDATVRIGAGDTIYNNTEWKAYNAPGVIDTSDPGFYVKQFTFQATLASGTLALTAGQPNLAAAYPLTTAGTHTMPVGIFSATESNILVTCAVPGTQTSVVGYGPTNSSSTALCTAGYVGTAAGAVFALASGQTTAGAGTSTVNVTVFNP